MIVCNFSFILVSTFLHPVSCAGSTFLCVLHSESASFTDLFFFFFSMGLRTRLIMNIYNFDFLFHMQGHIKYELSWTFQSRSVLCHQQS